MARFRFRCPFLYRVLVTVYVITFLIGRAPRIRLEIYLLTSDFFFLYCSVIVIFHVVLARRSRRRRRRPYEGARASIRGHGEQFNLSE